MKDKIVDHTEKIKFERRASRALDDDQIISQRTEELSNSFLNIINSIGEDSNRQGLLKTPQRAAKAIEDAFHLEAKYNILFVI